MVCAKIVKWRKCLRMWHCHWQLKLLNKQRIEEYRMVYNWDAPIWYWYWISIQFQTVLKYWKSEIMFSAHRYPDSKDYLAWMFRSFGWHTWMIGLVWSPCLSVILSQSRTRTQLWSQPDHMAHIWPHDCAILGSAVCYANWSFGPDFRRGISHIFKLVSGPNLVSFATSQCVFYHQIQEIWIRDAIKEK